MPRHQNLRKRGCAAGVNNSFTHGDEVKPRRYTHAPAVCCCVSAEPGGVQRRAGVLACPPKTPSCVRYVLTAACTSACAQQRVQPRATRSTTCSLLAGPLRCCRPASGSLRRATPSWTILGATASARTHATAHRARPVACAHPPAAVALTCTITHSAGLSRTIAAPTVGH